MEEDIIAKRAEPHVDAVAVGALQPLVISQRVGADLPDLPHAEKPIAGAWRKWAGHDSSLAFRAATVRGAFSHRSLTVAALELRKHSLGLELIMIVLAVDDHVARIDKQPAEASAEEH